MKYLMLDHGGVLDGTMCAESEITENDLVLSDEGFGYPNVLKYGVQIVHYLNQLIRDYDYQIVFHSKNKEIDQLEILGKLQTACQKKGLEFPPVYAMAVRDEIVYPKIVSTNPKISSNREGILIAGYSEELDGKACVRNALSALLEITPEKRGQHIVFDDGPSVIATAKREGYQTYLITGAISMESEGELLVDALAQVLAMEQSLFTFHNSL